jgi:hypothetical protein
MSVRRRKYEAESIVLLDGVECFPLEAIVFF